MLLLNKLLAVMKKLIITFGIAIFLLQSSNVEARFGRQDLERVVVSAQTIVDVTVVSSEVIEWLHTPEWTLRFGDTSKCGYKSTVRVNETFSDTNFEQLTLGSKEELIPGRRYLLFVREHAGDFANDVIFERVGVEKARFEECLSKLPLLKSNWLTTSYFSYGNDPEVTLSYWILPPQDLHHKTIEISEVMENGKLVPLVQSAMDMRIIDEFVLPRDIVLWKDLSSWIRRLKCNSANKSLNGDASDAGAH